MDVSVYAYTAGDPVLIDKIVNEFLSQGKFDKLRKECMADADTKPAYQNLQQRVESTVTQFLKQQVWKPDLNKNQLRDSLRKHILESGFLDAGINRIVDQIVNPNVLATVFMPEVEEVVYSYLSIPRPGDKSNKHCDNTKTYSNYKVKHQSTDEFKGKLDIDKDLRKSQKNEENQTNNFYERVKTEDVEDKTNTQNCENISSTESGTELQLETTRDIRSEIKLETEETEEMKECKLEIIQEDGNDSNAKFFSDKMELPSDESQESLSRMGVERLRISDSDGINAPDSDASLPLEINEKSMSDSRDSDDSIMNKMSPISQGRLTPEDICMEEEKETKEEKEEKEGKKPLTFVGRIPKIKRDDSELKKVEEIPKRLDAKSVYSSDESDSSKHSSSKSDADEKKKTTTEEERTEGSKEKSDRKYKDEDRKRKSDHHRSSDGRSHSRDEKREKSRSRRDEKDKSHSRSRDDRSRDKISSGDKKSSSSSSSSHSRSRSSSHHKSGHKSGSHDKEHHRDDSRSREKDRSRHERKDKDKRDFDKRKKEEEKRKKSKSVDDHGKERNRRDDRRSTDRDSNERERDKTKDTGSGVVQTDGKKREKDQKDEAKKEKTQKEESDSRIEREGEPAQTVKTEETVVLLKAEEEKGSIIEDFTFSQSNCSAEVMEEVPSGVVEPDIFDLKALFEKGALTKVRFPKVVDDFYVKFDSTGFRYFEDWETTKLDCEEEFKEYIDEAERDLTLLSDDGSDYESCEKHMNSEAMKRAIIEDSLRGIGNFHSSLMFDPVGYEFYAWKDEKEYRLRQGKETQDVGRSGSDRTREVDEDEMQCQADKNKENRDRGRRIRKSLKFLNRYHRKIGLTLKRGREQHRFVSRRRKPFPFGRGEIRERNAKPMDELKENQPEDVGQDGSSLREDGERSNEESVASTVPKMDVDAKIRLYQIQSMRRSKPESCQAKILARLTSGSRVGVDAEDGNENMIVDEEVVEVDEITKKVKKKGIRIGLPRPRPKTDLEVDMNRKLNQNFSLPLSPESDDSMFNNNGVISQKDAAKAIRKRPSDGYADLPSKKDCKRTLNQKYESQDLYKPRPFSIGSKTRGRALRVEENNFGEIDDGDK